ncbi:hypothetical protein CA951_13545 [Rhodococcus sp. NCIMB 12038]|nr:hypothetical protein CA951_13545 [Rhodococcus sp. NCIMB 12038]
MSVSSAQPNCGRSFGAGVLFALLDDVAALAKATAASVDDIGAGGGKASVKAAGVVVDDTAVIPRYVHRFSTNRELPIIRYRDALGRRPHPSGELCGEHLRTARCATLPTLRCGAPRWP